MSEEKYGLAYGDVAWSDIILYKGPRLLWEAFDPLEGYTGRHTLSGLQRWIADKKNGFWFEKKLEETEHEQIYKHDSSFFWIPFDIPHPDQVCRRSWDNNWKGKVRRESQVRYTWKLFLGSSDVASPINNQEALRKWLAENPKKGWRVDSLKQKPGHDQRIWTHGEDRSTNEGLHDEFWIPVAKTLLPDVKSVVCQNPLGCYLTAGKTYQVKGQDDGLYLIVDDLGNDRAFLPERFAK